jgi:hypothetical protein
MLLPILLDRYFATLKTPQQIRANTDWQYANGGFSDV